MTGVPSPETKGVCSQCSYKLVTTVQHTMHSQTMDMLCGRIIRAADADHVRPSLHFTLPGISDFFELSNIEYGPCTSRTFCRRLSSDGLCQSSTLRPHETLSVNQNNKLKEMFVSGHHIRDWMHHIRKAKTTAPMQAKGALDMRRWEGRDYPGGCGKANSCVLVPR